MASTQDSSPNSTNSSLQSWQRFQLDPKDKKKILVYNYRHGVETSNQEELCAMLEKDPTLRCSKLPIPAGHRRIEIHQVDLYPNSSPLRSQYASLPNAKTSLASIHLPSSVYYGRMVAGRYKEMFIVSRESSPEGSPSNSFYDRGMDGEGRSVS